jgi:predicted DNA-binding protein YlxM (UPF0122 family)
MVTKQDVDNILKQVNAILQRLDERLSALEEAEKKKAEAPKTTRTTKSS